MCRYNNTEEAKLYLSFVIENLGTMSIEQMAQELAAKIPDPPELIVEHFYEHSLHPSIRITHILRTLLELSKELKANIMGVDEHGNRAVDVKAADVYLKMQNQIIAIYKVGDMRKLLFA